MKSVNELQTEILQYLEQTASKSASTENLDFQPFSTHPNFLSAIKELEASGHIDVIRSMRHAEREILIVSLTEAGRKYLETLSTGTSTA